jgi:SAM-dependent methyltransferase
MGPEQHSRREQRLVFGEDAELYDAARPSYPERLIDDVVDLAGPGATVLDVGCGTGKAAVLLAQRGLAGVGVEAHPAMAAVARRHLAGYAGWRVEVSDFESWEPRSVEQPFDVVTSAQAWHWLDPAVRFRKAYQLLRPGGWLARWWNRPGDDSSPISQAMAAVYDKVVPDMPARGIGSKGAPSDDVPGNVAFGPPLQRTYRWTHTYTADEWTALLETQSDHRLLAPETRTVLLAAVRDVIEAHGGHYRHRYICWLRALQRQ